MKFPLNLLTSLITLTAFTSAPASVRVLLGPTPIPRAIARAAGDITVVNEKLAFALAVESAVPYGVPRGAIVAVAPVRHGRIDRNRAVFADFMPNNWSAWPKLVREGTIQHTRSGRKACTNPVWVRSP